LSRRLVITEKPSVARDIAAALGGFSEGDERLDSEDFVITWALGHLLELSEPQDYDPKFRSWSIKNLPIVPEVFQLKPREGQKKRLDTIKKLAHRKDVKGIVNACDAGREGELIFRRIVEYCGLGDMPQERLWLQSMTKQAIRDAFTQLRPGHDLDSLADAAWLRSIGDWLVGMNATRALTQRLKSRGEREAWSAGRVQTPTLALLVVREREILAHVPRPYWEIAATFVHDQGDGHTWEARYFDPAAGSDAAGEDEEAGDRRPNRIFDPEEVERVRRALADGPRGTASETRKKSRQSPPLPFDLTSLQREANRRFSMSARRTLNAAQRLYEAHKVLTYPRTDSRHLPGDYGPTVDTLLKSLAGMPALGEVAAIARRVAGAGPQNLPRILDSSKVRDHFAIVPTGNPVPAGLSGDDERVFDLAVRQFLAALMGPATWAVVERFVDVPAEKRPARFRATARALEVPGFLEALGQQAGVGSSLPALRPGSDEASGVEVGLQTFEVESKQTRPPGRYTEAQLLRMMETAGERVDDEELSEAMKERGLGTPATRADTIERLVSTSYARRVAGKLVPSSKAMRLMDVLERVAARELASPALTGEWEYALNEVENGHRTRADVQNALVDYAKEITEKVARFEHEHLYDGEPSLGICPNDGGKVMESVWGYRCENNQGKGSVCDFMIWKDRFGRYVDRSLAERLLQGGTVGPIEGFVDRGGREMLTGTLTLRKDEERGWILDAQIGAAVPGGEGDEAPEQVIGPAFPCLVHEDCQVLETSRRWVCERVLDRRERTGPVLPKKVCLRELQPEEVAGYFGAEGRTAMLEGFTSKRGRPFTGLLVRKATGKHGFEFPERAPRKKGGKGRGRKPRAEDESEV